LVYKNIDERGGILEHIDEKRWAEIQREGDQSWPFIVHTAQALSEEEATNMQKKFLSDLDGLLTPGKGNPFHLSNCPPNTSILIMFDNRAIFNSDHPWPLIEETLHDIQIKVGIVYIGKHFDKLPMQVENKILSYAPFNSQVMALIGNLRRASQLKIAPPSEGDSDDWDEDGNIIYRQWSAMIVGNGGGVSAALYRASSQRTCRRNHCQCVEMFGISFKGKITQERIVS